MSKRNKIITITSISCLFLTIAIILGYGFWTGRIKFKAAGQTFNVMNYGAKGDGVTNDTVAIQSAINAASAAGSGNTVYVPAGTYRVVAIVDDVVNHAGHVLIMKSNLTFQMDNAAEIRLDNTVDLTHYAIISAGGVHLHDVTVLGGTFTGDKYTHSGTTAGEWGHGIALYSCYNVLIDGVKSQKCWGDGFNFDGNNITEAHDFTMRNCVANDNRRQGLSIECCNNGTVINNTFSNTLGTSPQGGIDLEPWNSNQAVTNVNITGNTLTGNGGGMVAGGSTGSVTGNTISNNTISSNVGNGFWIDSCQNFTVTDNTINSNRNIGMELEGCTGWTVTGNHIENSGAESVVLTHGYNSSANSTGNHFYNNVITGSKVGGITLMNSSTGNVITGNWIWNNVGSNIWEDSSSQNNTISPNTFGPPSTSPPTVSSITPNTGVNSGSVNVTNLAGSNFVSGATVKLTKTGQTSISATSVQFVSASKITCTLPITGAATGTWNVVVTNPDTQSATLTNGFTVTSPSPVPPAQVTGLHHTGNTVSSIAWDWDDISGATGYKVYRVSDNLQLADVSSSTWTQGSLSLNTQYGVYVKAYNAAGQGTASAAASAYTSANPPTSAGHSSNTTTGITWTWQTNSNPAGTQFYASDSTGNSGWVTNGISWNASSGHSANNQYTLSIKAKNGNGDETSAVSASTYTSIENVTGVTWGTITSTSITLSGSGTLSNISAGSSGIYFRESVTNANSGWLKTNTWTKSGLSPNTPNTAYHFFITTRNGNGEQGIEQGSYDTYTLNDQPVQSSVRGKKSVMFNVANQPAGTIKYRLTTWNIGATAVNYTITDDLTDVLNHATITDTGGGTLNGTTLSYPQINLPAGGTAKRNNVIKEFMVQLKPADTWPAGDTVMSDIYLGSTTNSRLNYKKTQASSLSAFNVTQSTDATLTTANPGDTIKYTITAQNQGTLPDDNYLMQTDLSSILTYSTVENKGGGKVSGNTISWQVDVKLGSSVTKSFTAKLKPADSWSKGGDLVMTSNYGTNTKDVELTPQTNTDKVIAAIKNTFGPTSGAASASIIRTLTLPGTIIIIILLIVLIITLVYLIVRKARKK